MDFKFGSMWIRADFHLHTRANAGRFHYQGENGNYIKSYIQQMKQTGIRLGVITNHNKFDKDEYKALAKEGRREGIYILPAPPVPRAQNRKRCISIVLSCLLSVLSEFIDELWIMIVYLIIKVPSQIVSFELFAAAVRSGKILK